MYSRGVWRYGGKTTKSGVCLFPAGRQRKTTCIVQQQRRQETLQFFLGTKTYHPKNFANICPQLFELSCCAANIHTHTRRERERERETHTPNKRNRSHNLLGGKVNIEFPEHFAPWRRGTSVRLVCPAITVLSKRQLSLLKHLAVSTKYWSDCKAERSRQCLAEPGRLHCLGFWNPITESIYRPPMLLLLLLPLQLLCHLTGR